VTAALFAEAVMHHRAGRLADADRLYRRVLAADPHHADALFLLAGFDIHAGHLGPAIDKLRRAIAVRPEHAAYHANLGEAYRRLRNYKEAIDALEKAVSLRPDMAEGIYNLGATLEEVGALHGAAACFERAAELKAGWPEASARARSVRERTSDPKTPVAPVLRAMSAGAILLLARHHDAQGRVDRAEALARRALEVSPGLAPALNMLGVLLARDTMRVDEAIACFREGLAREPKAPELLGNLGYALGSVGRLDEAVDTMRASPALASDPVSHSSLVFLLPFHAGSGAQAIHAQAQEWDRLHARKVGGAARTLANDRSPERRLRVGYVSPDFRDHCQSFFTTPLFRHHDKAEVEVFVYSSVIRPDEHTKRLTAYADTWRSLRDADDKTAAEVIRRDRIDILVDLTMHMAYGRPLLFARRPAPVQVCWLAYPGTTGLSAIDYRLSDPHLDPPGADTSIYSERTVRLPDAFWCYDPLAEGPPVGPLPALTSGHVTFGCFNNFLKVNADVIALWSRVLHAVERSRLTLMVPPGEARERTLLAFAAAGIDASRLDLVDRRRRDEYLAAHGSIDIGLDTFPYNGHTTSLDALWMGVPVVTLVGETVVGRAGLCQAMNLGLPELVATTADEYIGIAAGLAADLGRLAALRVGLRARLEASPLMDGPRFAKAVEAAYRAVWREWCSGLGRGGEDGFRNR
jgi:predicted O-linked N-acetylglucosamine transferase (SPINDLY family)